MPCHDRRVVPEPGSKQKRGSRAYPVFSKFNVLNQVLFLHSFCSDIIFIFRYDHCEEIRVTLNHLYTLYRLQLLQGWVFPNAHFLMFFQRSTVPRQSEKSQKSEITLDKS